MSGYDGAMAILIAAASITAIAALWTVRHHDKLEREIREERKTNSAASSSN